MNEYICVFHFLFVLFVISLILPNLVYKCTLLNFMEVRAQLSNLFLSIIITRIKLLLYNLTMWFSYCHYVCNFWQMPQVTFNYSLTIEKLIFNSNIWVLINLFKLFKDIIFLKFIGNFLCIIKWKLHFFAYVIVVSLKLASYSVWWINSNVDWVSCPDLILI